MFSEIFQAETPQDFVDSCNQSSDDLVENLQETEGFYHAEDCSALLYNERNFASTEIELHLARCQICNVISLKVEGMIYQYGIIRDSILYLDDMVEADVADAVYHHLGVAFERLLQSTFESALQKVYYLSEGNEFLESLKKDENEPKDEQISIHEQWLDALEDGPVLEV